MNFYRTFVLACCAFLGVVGIGQSAGAQTPYRQTLQFDVAPATQNAVFGYTSPSFSAMVFSTSLAIPGGSRPYTVTVPGRQTEPLSQLLYLATSMSGTQLILGANTTYSATLVGKEFDTVFTGFSERELINALNVFYDPDSTTTQRDISLGQVSAFTSVLRSQGAGFGSSDPFSLTSFSTGAFAGNGRAAPQPIATAAVPEPATWLMLILGFAAAGSTIRHNRQTARRSPKAFPSLSHKRLISGIKV